MHRVPAAIIVCSAVASGAFAQTPVEDRSAIAQRAAERIRALQQEADRLAAESRTLLGDLRRLEIERQTAAEALAAAETALANITGALEEARGNVAQLEARRHHAAPTLAAELVEIYKRGRRRHAQVLLASAADGRALGRLIRGALALASAQRTRLDAHRRLLRAEQDAVADLERQVADAVASRNARLDARTALARAAAERTRLIDAIDRDRDAAARYAGELQSAQASLDQTLATLASSASARPALPIGPFKGDLDWPVRGVVQSPFGAGEPGHSTRGVVRNGIEVAATEGSSVSAIHGGRVSYAAPFLGLGALVVLDHGDGVQSLYGYLKNIAVTAGDRVDRGGLIGQVGLALGRVDGAAPTDPAGLTTSGALYFELRVDGRPVDPLQWLRSSP